MSTAVGAQQQAGAGKKPRVAPQAIEIRGQVPTPQVVTVRPRQIPEFSRAVLTPAYFDRRFWDVLLAPYAIVPARPPGAGATAIQLSPFALPADSGLRPSAVDTGSHNSRADSLSAAPSARPAAADTARPVTSNAPQEK
jgi:hypothetical protein